MAKVSIIIPVHNAEKYLDDAIGSILAQSYGDYEIMLVDDGSTDGSGKIIDSYAEKYENIKSLHKAWDGISSTRNLGLENISEDSRYVLFMDADDLIHPDALKTLVMALDTRPEAYMAYGTVAIFTETDGLEPVVEALAPARDEVLSKEECLEEFLDAKIVTTQRYLWNRLLRADVIKEKKVRFDEDIHYKEDGLYLVRYLLAGEGAVISMSDVVYYYRQTPTGACGTLACHTSKEKKSEAVKSWNPKILSNMDSHVRILDALRTNNISRRLVWKEIRNVFKSRRWILRRVIGHNPGRHKAAVSTFFKVIGPVIKSFFWIIANFIKN